ncbi:hypothetical protein D3C72_1603130 [compost metagenome]
MKRLRAWFTQGGTLTQQEALSRFGVARLSARIYDLKGEGCEVHKHTITVISRTTGEPCRVAEYWFAEGEV